MGEGLGVRIFDQLSHEQVRYLTCRVARHLHAEYSRNLGECRAVNGVKIRCVYSPSLVDLCQDTFAAVAADEATKLKGEDTIIGTGTRQLNPQFRLVLSATPIKNRLPDVFRLAHWGTGGHADAHPRFPYPDSAEAREEFAEEFMISERNLSREEDTGRRYQKLTPQVCNVHRLWKFFASCILRRRKKDCGEDIVAKHRHVIRMPMGRMQAEVYRYHLAAKYRDRNGRPAIGAQLMALRIAAADPTSALLKRPEHDGTAGTVRSSCSMVPKLFSTLGLLQDILLRGEQAIVFHTFHDSIDIMSARLTEAGVKHFVLDGRVSPAKRGRMAAEFKKQTVPLLLANSECMAEGHSFPRCNNVIHYSYPWALDKVLQSDDRVHRINSIREVNSYRAICTGSIDLRMEAQAEEKSDAADLVLDGQLLQKYVEELKMAELLQNAWQEFSAEHTDLIDERELVKAWSALRQQLAEVARHWVAGVTVTAGPSYPSPKIIIPTAPTPANIISVPFPSPPIAPEFRDLPLFAANL
jgi:SNF2 family DNA or RNA helicase